MNLLSFNLMAPILIMASLALSGCSFSGSITEFESSSLSKAPSSPPPSSPPPVAPTLSGFSNFDLFQLGKYDGNFFYTTTSVSSFFKSQSGNLYYIGGSASTWVVKKSTDDGSTWVTVDAYQYELGYTSVPYGIVVDSLENVFVLGTVTSSTSNKPRIVVRKGTGGGTSWTTVDEILLSQLDYVSITRMVIDSADNIYYSYYGFDTGSPPPFGTYSTGLRKGTAAGSVWSMVSDMVDTDPTADTFMVGNIAFDSLDNVYVTGWVINHSTWSFRWTLRKSVDGGLNWTNLTLTSSPYLYSSGMDTMLGIASNGDIYVGGVNSGNYKDWNVYRSKDQGASWILVDVYVYPADTMSAPKGFAEDLSGNLYVVGSGDSTKHWAVRKSLDGGTSWASVDEVTDPSVNQNHARAILVDAGGDIYVFGGARRAGVFSDSIIMVRKSSDEGLSWTVKTDATDKLGSGSAKAMGEDSSGNLFTVGSSKDNLGLDHWVVRKSMDSGASWITVDDFLYNPGMPSEASSIAIDLSGNLFVAGYGVDASSMRHWIVRRSTNGGLSWTKVRDFSYLPTTYSEAKSISRGPSGEIFVAGVVFDASWVSRGLMERSLDGGDNWSGVGEFILEPGADTALNQVKVSDLGNIYVTGLGLDNLWAQHWLVWKSTDGGSSWALVDDFDFDSTGDSEAIGIFVDSSENIFVTGRGREVSGINSHWLVRKSTNAGGSWATIDNVVAVNGTNARASSVTVDGSGNIYVAGQVDNFNLKQWITKKSTDGGITWEIIDQIASSASFVADIHRATPEGLTTCLNGRVCSVGSVQSFQSEKFWTVRISRFQPRSR